MQKALAKARRRVVFDIKGFGHHKANEDRLVGILKGLWSS